MIASGRGNDTRGEEEINTTPRPEQRREQMPKPETHDQNRPPDWFGNGIWAANEAKKTRCAVKKFSTRLWAARSEGLPHRTG